MDREETQIQPAKPPAPQAPADSSAPVRSPADNPDPTALDHAFIWLTVGLDHDEIVRRLERMGHDAANAENVILLARKRKATMDVSTGPPVPGIHQGFLRVGLLLLVLGASLPLLVGGFIPTALALLLIAGGLLLMVLAVTLGRQ